jgi:hypothetical protein
MASPAIPRSLVGKHRRLKKPVFRSLLPQADAIFLKATRVLVTAMEEAQVKRLICVTGFGSGDSRGRGGFLYNTAFHLLLGRVYDDKDVQERIIRNSKLDWAIVRPVIPACPVARIDQRAIGVRLRPIGYAIRART